HHNQAGCATRNAPCLAHPKKKQLPRAAFFLLPLFVLVGFQVRMVLLLFRGDSLPFVRSAIFIGALWAWLDAHAKLPFPLGLLNAAM
ncbi:hypothetical protein, partial [Pseudomonas rhodesiae]|uniref:hypothetical protein n=1 Tax=Pseudomonas rhodesiae TaxID=76760 RepID=UPI0028D63B04